jgi:hypothetical protein
VGLDIPIQTLSWYLALHGNHLCFGLGIGVL